MQDRQLVGSPPGCRIARSRENMEDSCAGDVDHSVETVDEDIGGRDGSRGQDRPADPHRGGMVPDLDVWRERHPPPSSVANTRDDET